MIKIYWNNPEKTILRADFLSDWTWKDYHDAVATLSEMNDGIQHQIHQLIYMRQTRAIPQHSALSAIMAGRRADPPNLGVTVVVAPPKIIEVLLDVIERAYGVRFPERRTVHTIEEAYQCITEFEEGQFEK